MKSAVRIFCAQHGDREIGAVRVDGKAVTFTATALQAKYHSAPGERVTEMVVRLDDGDIDDDRTLVVNCTDHGNFWLRAGELRALVIAWRESGRTQGVRVGRQSQIRRA